jgi:uncharacterized protein (DUF305 family)
MTTRFLWMTTARMRRTTDGRSFRWMGALLMLALVAAAPVAAQPAAGPADARFMRDMIGHHAQALEMVALVPDRAGRDDVRRIAGRIRVSQEDEIATMRRWLEAHGASAPAADAHGGHHGAPEHAQHGAADHAGMPGMATAEEMARLAASTGAAFDSLFLELMIRHHEGALVMVDELLSSGGGQTSEVFQIASEVAADQRMEIDRMRAMQQGPLPGTR